MKPEKPIMFDRDVAEMLGITVRTLQRRVLRPVDGTAYFLTCTQSLTVPRTLRSSKALLESVENKEVNK